MFYTILFFIPPPLIIPIPNLILPPIFNKPLPFHLHLTSFLLPTLIYFILPTIPYFLLLQPKL
nr:hypothetical protein [Staphylococcus warneri]